MNQVTTAKLVIALLGIVVFFFGIQNGSEPLRWIGISLVVLAVLMRFLRPRRPPEEERKGPRAP